MSCGDNVETDCSVADLSQIDHRCFAAQVFAARDATGLLVTQSELGRYYERWHRVVEAEPLFDIEPIRPQSYRAIGPGATKLLTTNPRVITSWPADAGPGVPLPVTGDAPFDTVMEQLANVEAFSPLNEIGDGVHSTTIVTTSLFSEEVLHARLQPANTSLPEPEMVPDRQDGSWRWLPAVGEDATAEIEIRWGWGDCLAGCAVLHDFRAVVPPTGPVTVYDLGGDPLPPHLQLSPNTRPLPR